ncbi:MAG: hydroxymethylglutaryl-CoA lyase [candidate division Zixibacteria bacterium]|nr:hydroxymethylglutaryl-CoA lyase [candidate division Zixibacteria bacterium]
MIRLIEVGPRDGLQNEAITVPTADKVQFINALSESGVDEIEASAFVSPKWVPQLADANDVLAQIQRRPNVTYSALVPNEKGLDRALAANVDKIAVFTAASEKFNRKNINASVARSLVRFVPVIRRAKEANLPIRGYVSTSFWCPYSGKIEPEAVVDVVQNLVDLGVDDISIGDTIGKAVPEEVDALLEQILPIVPAERLAMHFHNTYGHAVENVLRSYELGIRAFDASVGGVGGCPYAPSSLGNVPTEQVVMALREAGEEVSVDLDKMAAAREILSGALGRLLHATSPLP